MFGEDSDMSGPDIRRLYYSAREVCDIAGIKPHELRMWEEKYAALKPFRKKNGRRLFKPEDLNVVLQIKRLDGGKNIETGGSGDAPVNQIRHPGTEGMPDQSVEELRRLAKDIREVLQAILVILDKPASQYTPHHIQD